LPLILAFDNPLAPIGALFGALIHPIVIALHALLMSINSVTHNLAVSLIVLAVAIRLAFWPLNAMQMKSMAKMQKMQPHLKALQQKYRSDPQRLQQETMQLYREHGTSPVAGCLPALAQIPILFSIYRAITLDKAQFANAGFLWIGAPVPESFHPLLATSLAMPDIALLALYVISMFFSVRVSSPPVSDPQQAQQQQMMAFISPLVIAMVGRGWPSGLLLFWLATNIMQTIQSVLLMRGMRRADAAVLAADAPPTITIDSPRVSAPSRDAASGPKRLHKGSRRSSR
jgi:YidC/Oxa1 family membrane protein insertase